MDQATIDQDKADLIAAKQAAQMAAENVIAITKKLAEDERELARDGIIQDLEAHANTLEQSIADHVRDIAARVRSLWA